MPANMAQAATHPDAARGLVPRPANHSAAKLGLSLSHPALLAGLIVLLALGIRLIKPDFLALNDDEAFFVQLAHLGTYIQAMHVSEPHPPLYLAMLQGWMIAAGPTEFAIRYLTIIQGVLLVAAVYRLGRLIAGRPLGLAAAFAAAVNPYQIVYSQTARDYELACLFGALSFVFFLKALRRPRLVPLYAGFALLAMYSHYYAIGIVAFEQVLLLARLARAQRWRTELRPWLAGDAAIALLYLPWLAFVARTVASYEPGRGTPAIAWSGFVQAFDFYHFGEKFDPRAIFWPSLLVGLVVLLGLVGLWVVSGKRGLGLSVGYQLSVVVFGFVTFLHTSQFGARFIFIGSPGYFLVLGAAIVLLGRWWKPAAALPVLFLLYLGGQATYNRVLTNRYVTNGYRELAAYLAQRVAPNDTVLLDGVSQWLQYWYYADFRNGVHQRVEFMPRDAKGNGADGTPVSVPQTAAKLRELASSSSGLWYIDSDALRYDPNLDAERILTANWFPASSRTFVFQRIVYFGLAPAGALQPRTAAVQGFDLVQATAPSQPIAAGRPLGVSIVWRAQRDAPPPFKESLRLIAPSGAIAAQQDGDVQDGLFKFSNLKAGASFTDNRGVIVPVGTPPGAYRLQLVAYDPSNGRPLGQPLELGQVTVDHSQPQPALTDGFRTVGLAIASQQLLGVALPAAAIPAGSRLTLTLLWSGHPAPAPASVTLGLGGQTFEHPIGGGYPVTQWRPNDVVRDSVTVRVPARLAAGSYPLSIDGRPLGAVQVAAGNHAFAPPAIPHPLQAAFGQVAQLVGYDLQLAGGKAHLRLFWKVLGETDTSYTVFVHVLGSDGKIHGQTDLAPGTDNWVSGEFLTTDYDVQTDVGPGQGQIELGLYDGASGKRLPVCAGMPGCASPDDHLLIPLAPG